MSAVSEEVRAKRVRLVIGAMGAALALFLGALTVATFLGGARADACAEALVAAAGRRDGTYLERAVKSPSVRDELLAARSVELAFVRPMDSEWTRVGLFVAPARSSTVTKLIVLQLEVAGAGAGEGEGCAFMRDYESGAFGAGAP